MRKLSPRNGLNFGLELYDLRVRLATYTGANLSVFRMSGNQLVSNVNHSFLRRLRHLGTIEGVSTLFLFGVAMPLKYMAGMPKAVSIAGSLHGFLFVGLALMLMLAINRVPISKGLACAGIIAAVVPFGPFVYDHWLANVAQQTKESS